MLTFLKSEQLGVLENTLLEACNAQTRRKRQVALNSARRVLIELKLLERGIGPFGIGRGVNALGEQGFWIIPEANFASAKKAEPHVSIEAKGPLACTCVALQADGIHRDETCPLFDGMALMQSKAKGPGPCPSFNPENMTEFCSNCGFKRSSH